MPFCLSDRRTLQRGFSLELQNWRLCALRTRLLQALRMVKGPPHKTRSCDITSFNHPLFRRFGFISDRRARKPVEKNCIFRPVYLAKNPCKEFPLFNRLDLKVIHARENRSKKISFSDRFNSLKCFERLFLN